MNQYLRRKIWTLNRSGKFRGYLRTVSGYPVTLTDCMVGQPVSLAVDGNAVQDGTPTPDNPVDVQLCGDRILPLGYTAVEYIEGTGTQWIDTNFHTNQDSGIYLDAQLTEIPESITDGGPLFFRGCINNNFGIGIRSLSSNFAFMRKPGVGITDNSDTNIAIDTKRHVFKNNFLNDHYFTFDTQSKDAPNAIFSNNYGIAIFRTTYGRQGNYYNIPAKAKIYRLKISQDTEIIADVYPAKRDSDGVVGMYDIISNTFFTNSGTGSFIAGDGLTPVYRVTGNVRGLNLLSSAWEEGDISSSTGENSYSNPARIRTANYIECLPNTKYTFYSCDYIISGVRYYDEEKTYKGYAWTPNSNVLQFITPSDAVYMRLIVVGNDSNVVPDINETYMLVQGFYTTETMPAYESYREPQTFNIYTPQQLAKVGDTADTVVLDFDNKRAYINSMFIKTIYDGSENWTQTKSNAGEDKYVCVSPKISDALSSQNTYQKATAISNIFKLGPYAGASSGIECFIIYNKSIQIYHHGEPVDEFKQFLSELANSNNQLTVLCRRESSYVTDITALQDWDAMPPLWSGTAVITADTVIAPSAITAKYYASKPEEVN